MGKVGEKVRAFATNRWLVFVAAMWLQSMAGIGYLFGAISPVVKAALGYNQRQVAALGVAKDLGDCVGFLAGTLSATLPAWRCCSSAPPRTSSATAGSGSSSPGSSLRCPSP
ncbi:Os04g0388700 [Oryza sativa Japonica Group]|uniref:Os04g0388700 protein n=1 Tax=Oryza sativa subsp. japonica TaxID=39947 RepID=Q0JDP1_ORYSJ|nr:Os04g0388700 [Oryza sativa Japonica Group]|eukprot:NP_001052632.2 Os04g0388700 [Oryza sativa Japonica Group]